MTKDATPVDRFADIVNRILKPRTDADRDLMWTAAVAFCFGALVF